MDSDQLQRLIVARRKHLDMNQGDVATRINKLPQSYNRMEKNLENTTVGTLSSILIALDLQMIIIPKEQLSHQKQTTLKPRLK